MRRHNDAGNLVVSVLVIVVALIFLAWIYSVRVDNCMKAFPQYTREQCQVIVNK